MLDIFFIFILILAVLLQPCQGLYSAIGARYSGVPALPPLAELPTVPVPAPTVPLVFDLSIPRDPSVFKATGSAGFITTYTLKGRTKAPVRPQTAAAAYHQAPAPTLWVSGGANGTMPREVLVVMVQEAAGLPLGPSPILTAFEAANVCGEVAERLLLGLKGKIDPAAFSVPVLLRAFQPLGQPDVKDHTKVRTLARGRLPLRAPRLPLLHLLPPAPAPLPAASASFTFNATNLKAPSLASPTPLPLPLAPAAPMASPAAPASASEPVFHNDDLAIIPPLPRHQDPAGSLPPPKNARSWEEELQEYEEQLWSWTAPEPRPRKTLEQAIAEAEELLRGGGGPEEDPLYWRVWLLVALWALVYGMILEVATGGLVTCALCCALHGCAWLLRSLSLSLEQLHVRASKALVRAVVGKDFSAFTDLGNAICTPGAVSMCELDHLVALTGRMALREAALADRHLLYALVVGGEAGVRRYLTDDIILSLGLARRRAAAALPWFLQAKPYAAPTQGQALQYLHAFVGPVVVTREALRSLRVEALLQDEEEAERARVAAALVQQQQQAGGALVVAQRQRGEGLDINDLLEFGEKALCLKWIGEHICRTKAYQTAWKGFEGAVVFGVTKILRIRM